MKKLDARKKASKTRKKLMTDEFKYKISKYTSKAWADGKYKEARVGQSKWYTYFHSNGKDKSYYPDFFVHEWDQYVDIKNKYHYSIQKDKFDALSEQGHSIRIILKEELETLIKKQL